MKLSLRALLVLCTELILRCILSSSVFDDVKDWTFSGLEGVCMCMKERERKRERERERERIWKLFVIIDLSTLIHTYLRKSF